MELILQEYDYIVKDEMCVEEIVKQIESYASKSPEENWDMKINRFHLAAFAFNPLRRNVEIVHNTKKQSI